MNIKLENVSEEDKSIISNLLQLYLSNISLYFPIDMDQKTGLYIYDDIDKYFDKNKNNLALLIKCDNKIAGFAFIDFEDDRNIVQEIFVLNEYKRKGIGSNAVKKIFDKYKGLWVIKSLPCSESAELFWIRVVKEYTNNNFNIEHIGKYNRAVITFNSK